MAKKTADPGTVKLIYQLAGNPTWVFATGRATRDMQRLGLTKDDVCDAIREWIDNNKPVTEDETRNDPNHIGEIICIFKECQVQGHSLYVKVQIRENVKTGEYLLVISSHE